MIVVDTSVLIAFLRGFQTAAVEHLIRVERDGVPFLLPAICCQEVLQGAKDGGEWKLLLSALETQRILHSEEPWRTHLEAARIFFDARRQGITIRSTIDCLIAQLTMEADGILLHDDSDFERIKAVRPLRTISG